MEQQLSSRVPLCFRSPLARGTLGASLALAITTWPLNSVGAGNSILDALKGVAPKELQDVLGGGQLQRPSKQPADQPPGVSTAADVVSILGVGACANYAKQRGNRTAEARALCATGAALAVEMTLQLGTKIADGLREHEQRKVLAAAADSLMTGEPSVVDLPDSGTSVAVSPVGAESTREVKVELLIDSAAVLDVPLMRVLGQAHEIRGAQKLRSGPAATASAVGSLKSGETVHVIGRVEGGDSVLVSRWLAADGVARPIGTGYISSAALQPSKNKDFPGESDMLKSAPKMKTITVNAILKCQSLDFQKKDSKGNRVQDTSYLCIGPDGSTHSA